MRRVLVVLLTVAAGSVAVAAVPRVPARATSGAKPPNILVVLTDDLDSAELRYMPQTRRLVGAEGAAFDHYFVSNTLCCPSRVTTLRGQYAHNTGVWSNGGTNGGFERAFTDGLEQDTVATRLSAVGYRTGLVGKYLNGYPNLAGPGYRPPGWHTWVSPIGGHPYSEYQYTLNDDGRFVDHRGRSSDYGTNAYVHRTQHFIRVAAEAHTPFFAYLAVYAPHQPAMPAPIDEQKFPRARVPRSAAFDQRDVSAMPRFVRDLPRFGPGERAAIDDLYRLRIRSLQAVDRGVASLVRTLSELGQLDNTYIVFTSDNGFHLGQHRLPAGKQTAYDTDTHVPFLVRGPGITPGTRAHELTGNVDLAPTFEAMAGAREPTFTDGRSLLGLAEGYTPRRWRSAYLVEHRNETGSGGGAARRGRSLPLEPPDPDQGGAVRHARWPRAHGHLAEPRDRRTLARRAPIPDYDAVRTARALYVQYANGDRELYDTRSDPEEIHNLAGTQPRLEHALATRLARLRACHGHSCRVADSEPAT